MITVVILSYSVFCIHECLKGQDHIRNSWEKFLSQFWKASHVIDTAGQSKTTVSQRDYISILLMSGFPLNHHNSIGLGLLSLT